MSKQYNFEDFFPSGNALTTSSLGLSDNSEVSSFRTTTPWVFAGGLSGSKTVISGQGASPVLTSAQSGSVCLFDKADGITYTLPAPVVGLTFDFFVAVTVTSNSYKIITNAGTVLLAGSILGSKDNTANKSWVGDGATHIAVTQAAASTNATGGIIGSWVRVACVTSTLWVVQGLTVAGGTPTTPFATS